MDQVRTTFPELVMWGFVAYWVFAIAVLLVVSLRKLIAVSVKILTAAQESNE